MYTLGCTSKWDHTSNSEYIGSFMTTETSRPTQMMDETIQNLTKSKSDDSHMCERPPIKQPLEKPETSAGTLGQQFLNMKNVIPFESELQHPCRIRGGSDGVVERGSSGGL